MLNRRNPAAKTQSGLGITIDIKLQIAFCKISPPAALGQTPKNRFRFRQGDSLQAAGDLQAITGIRIRPHHLVNLIPGYLQTALTTVNGSGQLEIFALVLRLRTPLTRKSGKE